MIDAMYNVEREIPMKAVMYGGGNIGRGFIGTLFSASGYETVFIDVVDAVVNTLNREHKYPVRILSNEGHRDIEVTNVSAVDGKNADLVADTIASADILATAVGVNVLKFIVPNIAEGIRRRMNRNGGPLDIIICENLMDANKVIEDMLKALLSEEEQVWFDANIGLVEASIGRMVPVQTEEMKDGNPMRVCVESYGYLPVDKAAFKGEIPAIKNMVPFEPFDFYIKRKLYVHNMGHATCAYLGDLQDLEYIYESIDRDETYAVVKLAMEESALALSKHYGVPMESLSLHINDLLYRFTNVALKDTCKRVGGDPARKLSAHDRLIGSSALVLKTGEIPAYIAIGAAAGLKRFVSEKELPQTVENAKALLLEVSGLEPDEILVKLIMDMYAMILAGASIGQLRRAADKIKAANRSNVI